MLFLVFFRLTRQMPAQGLTSSQATTISYHIPYNSLITTISYILTLEVVQSLLIKNNKQQAV